MSAQKRHYSPLPSRLQLFRQMIMTRRSGLQAGETVARIEASTDPIQTNIDKHTKWADLTGYRVEDGLPIPWPFVEAMPLTMTVIADSVWPLNPIGMVHIRQTISQYLPVLMHRPWTASLVVEGHEAVRQGRLFNFVTRIHQDDIVRQVVESRYLARGTGGNPDAPRDTPLARPKNLSGPEWSFAADAGRQYAKISGDYNPIHLWKLTAKPLGFNRHILHGMAAAAKMAKVMEDRAGWTGVCPSKLDIEFKKPLFLPGTAIADIWEKDDHVGGVLWPETGDAPHMIMTLDQIDPITQSRIQSG